MNMHELAVEFRKLNELIRTANADPFPHVGDFAAFREVDKLRNQLGGVLYNRVPDSASVLLKVHVTCPAQEACAMEVGRLMRLAQSKGICCE